MPIITINITLRSVVVIAVLAGLGYLVFGKTGDDISVADAMRNIFIYRAGS